MTASLLSERQVLKREQIASAARKLFLAHGFAGTSMGAVTAEAGVSKQTVYRYFPTKVALLGDILYGGLNSLVLLPPDLSKLNTLAEVRSSMVDFAVTVTHSLMRPESIALFRLVLGEAFRVAEIRRAFRDALPGQMLARTELLIRHAADKGLIATQDPALTARMFVGPLMTYVALDGFLSIEPSPPPSRTQLEAVIDAFLAGVRVDQ
ncbi:MAG: TetR/AcrR family transcriptional regulator [Propionibacteriaceae bacterium]|nr:TetR/AcrR family transcriptional regulator [Propionibacteriaceae bacterium]